MKIFRIVLLFAVIFTGFAAGEDVDIRVKYKDAFFQMQDFHKSIYLKEAMERSDHLGLGISGNFIFDIDWSTVRQSEFRQGFISVSANYWFFYVFNASLEGGLHRSAAREVWTVSAMFQLVGPAVGQLERVPNGTGIEAGFKTYLSNVTGESVTCLKLGICGYQFISKNLAMDFGIDWITPAYLGNSFEIRGGLKYYFF